MTDNPRSILPNTGDEIEPLLPMAELSAAMEGFERAYPEVSWQTASDEAVERYTAFARQAARHLTMLHYEVADMIYAGHISFFTAMGDSAILCAVACLHFSRAEDEQAKNAVMKNLNGWSVNLPSHRDERWLANRWKQLYGPTGAQALMELWDELQALYQFYLSRPDWG